MMGKTPQFLGRIEVLKLCKGAYCKTPVSQKQKRQAAHPEREKPKKWRCEIDLLATQKQVDTIDMKAMREEVKAVERLRKAADQLDRQERDKPRDRGPER